MNGLATKFKFFLPAAIALVLLPAAASAVVVGKRTTGYLTPQPGVGSPGTELEFAL